MTQHTKDKRNRSVKLCQLVHERKADSTINLEIKKLLEEGVLIDFQDKNRHNKSAIHLAVEKCDIVCAKFLLQFKPSLEVKDEDGRTPIDLAELHGYQNILNILLNSTVDVVNESYIEVIDYESLTSAKVEAIKSRSTFKVLKLINCPSVNEVWEKFNDQGYTKALNESSHLFFIAIETNEANIENDHELMKKVLNLRRPMIVQLTSQKRKHTKIYFKDDKKDIVEITETPQMTQEEFNDAVESDDEFNLKLLVTALRSNLFGSFTGDLLNTKLNTNEIRNETVNQFARSNALCHRFFKLFDESPLHIDRIVATLSFKGDQSLLALLDLPLELNEDKLKLDETQQDILRVVDSSGCNLLMMAVEQSNLNAIKLLLRCGSDFNHSDNYEKRASDISWKMKDFDCLAELIEAGSPYPSNFRIDEVVESPEAHERISKMIETINSFHIKVEQGETEEVKKFITSHPHIKHAFDTTNKCALTVALQSKEIKIYSLLLSEGFEPGVDDEYQSAFSKSSDKYEIRNSHREYFKEAFNEPHLKRLSKMSKLSFGSKDRAKCSTIIRKMFEELNQIDEVIPILKICSLCDKLRIVFDFNCNSVIEMDPTARLQCDPSVVYPMAAFIYLGVKNYETEFYKVIGALIHELTHYAMKLTYENGCKPYDEGDNEIMNQFKDITTETKKVCDVNPSTDPIVATVFNLYDQSDCHQELIVRVPHSLAHYKMNPKALRAAERNTPGLFHFYREKTLKDVERKSKALLQKYLISEINNQTGIARKIQNLNVKFENVEIFLKPSANVITSNAPQLTLSMLNQAFKSDSHIFVTLEQIAIGNILNKIFKVNAKERSTTLIIDCIGQTQKYPESVRKLIKSVKNIKTVALVMTEAESSKVKEIFSEVLVEFKTLNHKWGELSESSKVNLLNQNLIFQGVEMKLSELVEPSSEAMNFFLLNELVGCENFKIGNEFIRASHKFYIARKFIRKGQESLTRVTKNGAKSFEELLVESRMGAMIISDDAGSGKTATLIEIAKSLHDAFPDRWVQFVDLKLHIEAFKNIDDYKKIEAFSDFISEYILKNEPEFDRELFKKMFRDGKTFVLFDGFDEISPNYKDLLLHVLKLFEPQSGNQLYITTRPHLESDLECALGKFVFKLEKFSKESKINFLTKYFESMAFELDEDSKILSKRLLEFFSKISRSEVVGLPLSMRMIAEITAGINRNNSDKVSLNVASVFKEFVNKYFARWTRNENEIYLNEKVEFLRSGGILEVYHKIAINHIFGAKFAVLEAYHSDSEKISRVGLIRYDKVEKTFQFIHETFAEYFVADFICFHLERKNRDPSHDCQKTIEVLGQLVKRSRGVLDSSHKEYFGGEVIRTFLDQTLEAMKFSPNEVACQSLAKCFTEVVESQSCFYILSESCVVLGENIFIILLSIVKRADKDFLLKMLESRNHFDNTALLDAVKYRSSKSVSTLCQIIVTLVDNPKRIFQEENASGNVLFSTARNNNHGVLTALCESLKTFLTREEIKIMMQEVSLGGGSIIHEAVEQSSDEAFNELLSLLPQYLSPNELKTLLRTADSVDQNCFHRAVERSNKRILKSLINYAKGIFDTKEDQKAFFQQHTIRFQKNFFHLAAENKNEEIFQTLIESTCDVLLNDDFRSMLKQKDSDKSNVLHVLAEHGNVSKLNKMNSLLRKFLSKDDLRSLLLQVNSKGQNCFRLAANNPELNLQTFCDSIGNLLSIEDQTRLLQQSIHDIDIIRLAYESNLMEIVPVETIRELLTKEYRQGRNVFLVVASKTDVDAWNKLISFAQSRLSADEMKFFLFCCDKNGKDCLKIVVSGSARENMIEAIFKTIEAVLSVEDQKMLVRQRDSAGRNVFHHAAASFDKIKCFSLYDGLSAILSKDEIKEMLKEKDSDGNNILCSRNNLAPHGSELMDMIAFLKELLTNDEIKNLIFDVDHEGRNFFHRAVEFSSKAAIKSLSKAIKKILGQDEQKRFFGVKSTNVFQLALRNPNSKIFSTLHECLKKVLTEDEIRSLILEKNSERKIGLHLPCLALILLFAGSYAKEILTENQTEKQMINSKAAILLRKSLKRSHKWPGNLVKSQIYSNQKAVTGKCPDTLLFNPYYTGKCIQIFEDNFSFRLTSEILPPKSVIEVRPIFVDCNVKRTSAVNEDQGRGEGGSNSTRLQNLRTNRSPDVFKNDKVSSRKRESSGLGVEGIQGGRNRPDLKTETGDQTLLTSSNSTPSPSPQPPDPDNQKPIWPPPQPPDPGNQNPTRLPPQSPDPDYQNPRELFIERQLQLKLPDNSGNKFSVGDPNNLPCVSEHRIVILSGERFTGKTTILLKYRDTLKAHLPKPARNSIIYVDLKHTIKNDEEVQLNSNQEIAEYFCSLCSVYFPNKSARQDFVTSFTNNSAIILLDNLDDENYNHLNLIGAIKNHTENQLWVAIQPHLDKIIEKHLKIKIYKILDFSPEQLKEYILQNVKNQSVCDEIDGCLKFLTGNAQFERNLLLLQCFLATFESTTHKIPGGNYFHTCTKMMEKYVERIRSEVALTVSDLHKMAFRSVFKSTRNLDDELFENALNDTEAMNLSGLVHWSETGFTNQRIAEFLIAHYLFSNVFLNENQNERASYLLQISVGKEGIRKFLDDAFQLLTNKSYSAQREKVSFIVERIFIHEELHNIFHAFLGDGLTTFVVTVSSMLSARKSLAVEKMWLHEDKRKRNPFMIAAQRLPETFLKKILDCAQSVVDLNDSLFLHDLQKQTVFYYASKNTETKIFEALINSLNSDDDKNQEKCIATMLGLKDDQELCCKKFEDIPICILVKFGAEAVLTHLLSRSNQSVAVLFEIFSPFLDKKNSDIEELSKVIQNKLLKANDQKLEKFLSYRKEKLDRTRNGEEKSELERTSHQALSMSSDESHESEEKQDFKDSGKKVLDRVRGFCSQFGLSNQKSCSNNINASNILPGPSGESHCVIALMGLLGFCVFMTSRR